MLNDEEKSILDEYNQSVKKLADQLLTGELEGFILFAVVRDSEFDEERHYIQIGCDNAAEFFPAFTESFASVVDKSKGTIQ